jgi:thiamine-phosphate pyrophosphorylase
MLVTGGTLSAGRDELDHFVGQVGPAIDAGLPLLHVREPLMDAGALSTLVRVLVQRAKGTRCRIVVNDRLDTALAAGAHGVHLRSSSPHASRIRAVTPADFLIGRSIHAPEEALPAGPVDYLMAGAVFGSGEKPARGTAWLSAVCASAHVPVIAVGGIAPTRPDTVRSVVDAGGAGVAAISCFLPAGTRPDAIGAAAATDALIELMAGRMHE